MAAPRDPRDGADPSARRGAPRSDTGWVRPSERRRAARGPRQPRRRRRPHRGERPPRQRRTRRRRAEQRRRRVRRRGEPAGATVAGFAAPNGANGSSSPRTRGRKRQRDRRRVIAAGVALLAVLALIGGIVLTSRRWAHATVEKVQLKVRRPPRRGRPRRSPSPRPRSSRSSPTRSRPRREGRRHVSPKTATGWPARCSSPAEARVVRVLLPSVRRHGGWVPQADVTVSTTTYKITVQLSAIICGCRTRASRSSDTPAVIGNGSTPTPTGLLRHRPVDLRSNPNTATGCSRSAYRASRTC